MSKGTERLRSIISQLEAVKQVFVGRWNPGDPTTTVDAKWQLVQELAQIVLEQQQRIDDLEAKGKP